MTTRRRLSVTDKLRIVTAQARCPLCGEKLGALDGCHFDHAHALALGGPDSVGNLVAVHKDCHDRKTFGRKPGAERTVTTAGSDVGNIAKARRLTKKQEEARRRMLARGEGEWPKSKWPKRSFPKRRKARG